MSGEPGHPGAKSRLKYKMGNREIEMIETILTRNLPEEFSGTYDAGPVYNIVKNSFVPLDEDKTRWKVYQEFKFSGFMRIIAWLRPGSFKKQSMEHMGLFKEFAEGDHE
jgi:hypothetical protein